jgi:hypothetical protein
MLVRRSWQLAEQGLVEPEPPPGVRELVDRVGAFPDRVAAAGV